MPSRRAGFTLIELVVGLAIMVMVATVITPVLLGSLDRARVDEAAERLTSLATSLSEFAADVKEYPGTLSQLSRVITTEDRNSCGWPFQPGDVSQWGGPYVDRILPETGVPVFIGTAQNQVVRAPDTQTSAGNFGIVRIQVTGVAASDAAALDERVDGGDGSAAGTITWSGAGTTLLLYYSIPTKGC